MRAERGSILIAVAFLAVLFGTLSLSMLSLTASDTEEIFNHLHASRALTVAEAGVEHAIMMLRNDAGWQSGLSEVTFPAASSSSYSVTVDASAYPSVTLVASGEVEGFTRELEVVVVVSGPPTAAPYPVRIESWREL